MNEGTNNMRQEPMRFLVFSVSLRDGSLNTRLAKLAATIVEKNGGRVDYANMSEFDCPSFNQDLEINNSHPAGAEEFRKRILANDAFIIASPEYNGSMPGLLKKHNVALPLNALSATQLFNSMGKEKPETK